MIAKLLKSAKKERAILMKIGLYMVSKLYFLPLNNKLEFFSIKKPTNKIYKV